MVRSGARRSSASVRSARPVNDSICPLRSSCRRTPALRAPLAVRRSDEERQVEARLVRPAVEVQPFGPRVGPRRRVGNAVEAIDAAAARSSGGACVHATSAGESRHAAIARCLRVAERALEAGNAAARRDAGRAARCAAETGRWCARRPRRECAVGGRRTAACRTSTSRAGTGRPRRIDDVAAADERRRLRLFEHDPGDAEQDRHHRDADAEAGGEHGAADRMRGQRAQRQPSDHRVASRSIRPSRIVSTRARAVGQRRVVRDDDERRAVGVDAIEQRRRSARRWPRPARRSARRPAAAAAGWRARARSRRAASRRPRAATAGDRRAATRPTYSSSSFVRCWRSRSRRAGLGLRQLDVLGGRQHRQQEEALEDEADVPQPQRAALRSRTARETSWPSKQQRAGRGRVHAAEHVQQRRLAAARRPADGDVLAGANLQRDVAHRVYRSGRHREHAASTLLRVDDQRRSRRRHPITSSRSVAAIGRRETMRIG